MQPPPPKELTRKAMLELDREKRGLDLADSTKKSASMRHINFKNSVVMFAAFVLLGASSASASDDPTGIWLTQAGDAKVAVSRCGPALCGRVVWLKSPSDNATGRPQGDDKNPNPHLAKQASIGLEVFIPQ